MEKKLYFLPADDLWEDESLDDISDEQFKLRSEVYYDKDMGESMSKSAILDLSAPD